MKNKKNKKKSCVLLSKTLKKYIHSLFENIKREIPEKIDLILDGGAFNGGYMLGSLYYLKEMEKKSLLKIERISSCSIGSILGFLYLTDSLVYGENAYQELMTHVRNHQNLSCASDLIQKLVSLVLKKKFGGNKKMLLDTLKERFYVSFFDIQQKKQIQQTSYESIEELVLLLTRTAYLPFVIDGNIMDQDGCMDGFYPYIFKEREKKILFIRLMTWKKMWNSFQLKQERNVHSRVWTGIDDINRFFMNGGKYPTNMCSYVNDWSLTQHGYEHLKELLWTTIISLIIVCQYLEKYTPGIIKNNILFIKSCHIMKSFYNEIVVSCMW